MNEIVREYTLCALTVQRNISLAVVFLLLILSLVLSALLFTKSERVVVVPAIVEKEFWVEGSNISPTYLEQMGCFVGDLLLTRSPASSDMQLTILMRHTDQTFASILSQKLASELSKLKKDNTFYVFFRTGVIVEPGRNSVVLEGERTLILGNKVLSKTHEKYRLGFKNRNGQLFLVSIERTED